MKLLNLLKKIKSILLYGSLSKEDFAMVKDEVQKSNKKNLLVFSIIYIVYMSILLIVANFNDLARTNFWIYIAQLVLGIICFVFAKWVIKDNSYVTFGFVYFFIASLLVCSILSGTITSIDKKTVIYPAYLLLVPLLFIDRPFKFDITLTLSVIFFCVYGYFIKDRTIYKQDLLNVIMLYLASIVINAYILSVKFCNLANDKKISILSELDVLTGLKNRNCYERKIQEYQKDDHQNCQLLFFDVNGLHEINNNLGHDEGDKMLKFIAKNIKDIFGEEDTYRIGGDEFIALTIDHFDMNLDDKIQQFKNIIEKENYHVSVGYQSSFEHCYDMTALSKMAEDKMYENKDNYYKTNNISRPSRTILRK
jgi:diguanylate cyclase